MNILEEAVEIKFDMPEELTPFTSLLVFGEVIYNVNLDTDEVRIIDPRYFDYTEF